MFGPRSPGLRRQRDVVASCMEGQKHECVGCGRCCSHYALAQLQCGLGLGMNMGLRKQMGLVSSIAFLTEMCFNKGLCGMAFLLPSSCSSDPIFSLHRVVAFPGLPRLSFLPMVTLHHEGIISRSGWEHSE